MTDDNISFDLEENTVLYTIPEDNDTAFEQYCTIPVVHDFIDREITNKLLVVHDVERKYTSAYEVRGFLLHHAGERFTLKL